MKILQISSKLPYPPDDGGKIVAYNTLKYLALRGHEITLISLGNELNRVPELEKYCKLEVIEKDTTTSIFGLLLNFFSKIPYTISKYHSNVIKIKLKDVLNKNNFDIVQVEPLHMAYYGKFIKKKFNIPVVLREYNVETTLMKRFYRNQKNLFVKAYAFLQYKKLYKYESTVCQYFDRCFMITEKDAGLVKQMNSAIKTAVIPSGVDTSYFYPLDRDEEPYSIVSVASMDWLPNVEGILWFYKEIFPLVKEIIPEVKLYIVGKNPPDNIEGLKNEGVFVSGFVDDVREYISKGRVFIVPLKTGSGMRIKILNALAMGKPVISTSIGCEGIEAQHGKHIYIADTKEEFAQGVIELLKREDMRRELREEGLRLVKEKYQWERVAEEMEKEYRAMIDGKNVRHEIERIFSNKQVETPSVSKFYEFGVLESIDNYCFNLLEKGGLIGKDIIDYGCGSGWASFRLAKQGANVFAFDVSDETIKALSQKAKQEKLLGTITAKVMVAESLDYVNESVDGIIGFGILHHLNLDLAIPEIYRVVRPGGKIVFREPLGKNIIINLFRFLTPNRRTPTEKPLDFSDIKKFEKYGFSEVKHTEFYLLGLLAFAMIGFKSRKLYDLTFYALSKIDRLIMRIFPWLRKYCWITVIEIKK